MTRKRGGAAKNNRADLIESIRSVVAWLKTQESDELSPDIALSVDRLTAFVAAFDKLAPDWSKAPIEANYYTVSSSGLCRWHVDDPQINEIVQSWNSEYVLPPRFALHVELQDGLDWKFCKWQRPKVAAKEGKA